MKKILIATNLLLLSLLLFSYAENDTPQNTLDRNIKLGVNPQLSKDMIAGYKSAIWGNRKIGGKTSMDARSIWFSIAKLKKFIADIEDQTSRQGCRADTFGLGIRFYYSAYPDSTAWNKYSNYFAEHNIPANYGGLHTVLMVPTLWNPSDSFNYDFDPRKFSGNCIPTPIKDVMENLITEKSMASNPFPLGYKSAIPANQSYMVIPDNLDNMRFIPKQGAGENSIPTANNPTTNFANGGTLIPPPYPPGTGSSSGAGIVRANSNMVYQFYVPYSGASFMRFADGTNTCGWNTISIKDLEKAKTPVGLPQ
jgi:hypothetical protein